MPTGIRPRVNEAREFLEIAKDFREPKEIIREALSNSWDANATEVSFEFMLSPIPGTRAKRIDVRISDNGEGMNDTTISDFFDLGESHKPKGSIGTKGHGTKIYYKSQGISVDTWYSGAHIHAETEMPPWPSLTQGKVPTYRWDIVGNDDGKGTIINIQGFEAKQNDFKDFQELVRYIYWYTIEGSFGSYFGQTKSLKVALKSLELMTSATIEFGFKFPKEELDFKKGTSNVCKVFPAEIIDCGIASSGAKVQLNVVGAILGDSLRNIVPETYTHMGIWLCKDYIKVERVNQVIEDVAGGQYFYRPFLILANCQQLDLTANRDAFHRGDEEFELAFDKLKEYFKRIWNDQFTKEYFQASKKEEETKKTGKERALKEESEKKQQQAITERVKAYGNRMPLQVSGVVNHPIKEPTNEAETILVLQAMISSKHPSIDFLIGEYSSYSGQDFIIEYEDKGIRQKAWAEVVYSLDRLYQWQHDLSHIHRIVCWRRGNIPPDAKLLKMGQGIYTMQVNSESFRVYVLSEILT